MYNKISAIITQIFFFTLYAIAIQSSLQHHQSQMWRFASHTQCHYICSIAITIQMCVTSLSQTGQGILIIIIECSINSYICILKKHRKRCFICKSVLFFQISFFCNISCNLNRNPFRYNYSSPCMISFYPVHFIRIILISEKCNSSIRSFFY